MTFNKMLIRCVRGINLANMLSSTYVWNIRESMGLQDRLIMVEPPR